MEQVPMEIGRVYEYAEFCTRRDEHWVQFQELLEKIQQGTLEEIMDHIHTLYYLAQKLIWYKNLRPRPLRGLIALKDYVVQETEQEELFVEVMHFIATRALDIKDMFPEDRVRILSTHQEA